MAAMAAAQMLQGAQNAESKRQVDAAGIRYSPWTKISQLPFTPDKEADTAMQGYAGVTGQMQNQKSGALNDRLTEAQIQYMNSRSGGAQPGGSLMDQYDPDAELVRGYELNPGIKSGVDHYASRNPWQQSLNQKMAKGY
jgi:hypothetical protein